MTREKQPLGTWGRIRRTKNKVGTPTACARYRGWDGKYMQVSATGATGAAAESALLEKLSALKADEQLPVIGSNMRTIIEAWFSEYKKVKAPAAGTVTRYAGVIENHVLPALGELQPREARTPIINAFLLTLHANTGYSTAQLARILLRQAFQYAIRMGFLTVNPVDACTSFKAPEREPVAWSVEQIRSMRQRLKAWDNSEDKRGQRVSDLADPSDFMLGTGCRPGEVFALEWSDIDLEATPMTVRIHKTVTRDRRNKTTIQPHTKTRRVRTLTLPDFVSVMLLRRRVNSLTDLVFPSSTGTVRHPSNFRTQWQQALAEDMEMFDMVPRNYRSSVATLLANEVSLEVARDQLGHSTSRTTEKHYAARDGVAPDMRSILARFG